jgi:antitoxin CcdA
MISEVPIFLLPYHEAQEMNHKSSRMSKKATNVSVRRDLLDAARAANINLSATLELALAAELTRVRRDKWLNENREAIAAHNDFMTEHGVFSGGLRSSG